MLRITSSLFTKIRPNFKFQAFYIDNMSEIKLGRRLRFFKPYWQSFCKDRYVMCMLSGIKIPFKNGKIPHQVKEQPELSMMDEEKIFVDNHLLELLQEGCIKKLEAPLPHGWVSHIFFSTKTKWQVQDDS